MAITPAAKEVMGLVSEHANAPAKLEESGYKLTRQRRELLSALTSLDRMITAEELHQHVQSAQPGVSLSTIYRNLDLLAALGLLCRVDVGDGTARYGARKVDEHHHHLLCLGCGKHFHLNCPMPDLRSVLPPGFTVTGHRFEIYGYCEACQPTT
jgi:Fur family zinc uptake transcriptional regulator